MKEITNIKFYGAIEFANKVIKLGLDKVLKNKETRELFFCHPLMMREALSRKRKLAIGKIDGEDNPFDIIIVDEEELKDFHKDSKLIMLRDPLYIQLKELRIYGSKDLLTIDQWRIHLQAQIDKIAEGIKIEPKGILHFHNKIPFKKVSAQTFRSKMEALNFPERFPYKQVTLSMEVLNEDGTPKGMHTWQFHPNFWPIGALENSDMFELREIYGLPNL